MLWLKELLTATPPQTSYLLYPILRPATKLTIIGPTKTHKSFMLHTVMYSLATGVPLWGNPHFWVRQPTAGILFSQELTQDVLKERWMQHVQGSGMPPSAFQNIAIVPKGAYSLDARDGHKWNNLWKEIEQFRQSRGYWPSWIALDPISKFHHRPENHQEEVMVIIQVMDAIIQRTGAAIIFVHHEGVPSKEKDEFRYGVVRGRGSSQWGADVDAGMIIKLDRKRKLHRVDFDLRHAPEEPSIVATLDSETLLFRWGWQIEEHIDLSEEDKETT